jgi:tRNA threonylcarbamoyladenosine biosynthesis protein TsaE
VIYLHGDLGAGKTTLTRGMLAALGHHGRVKSPSYTLLEPYTFSRLDFYHFDLYRFRDEQEWHDAGFREHFNERSVCVVEWPEKAAQLLPPPDLDITLDVEQRLGHSGRAFSIEARSERGTACLDRIHHAPDSSRR